MEVSFRDRAPASSRGCRRSRIPVNPPPLPPQVLTLKNITPLLAVAQLTVLSAQARLSAWFPLNEGPGAPAGIAEVVENLDGIPINPDLISAGRPSFHGRDGTAYVIQKGGGLDLGGTEAVQPTDKFTISFWVRPLSFAPNARLFETQVGGANGQNGIRIDLGAAPGNHVRVVIRDGGTAKTELTHSLALKNDGTWYFVALRYDSTLGNASAAKLTVVEALAQEATPQQVTASTQSPTALSTGPLHYPHARATTLIGLETEAGNASNVHAAFDDLAFYSDTDGKGVLSDADLAASFNHGPTGVPLINTFTAAANNVAAGGGAALSWNVNTPLDSLTLRQGDAAPTDVLALTTAGAGAISLPQTESATYTLRAEGAGGVNFSTVRVVTGAPVITAFTSSAALLRAGESVTLSWETDGADTLTLSPGAAAVTVQKQITLTPAASGLYTLTATNSAGSTTAQTYVRVTTGPLPANSYLAALDTNDETVWRDETGSKNLPLSGLLRHSPLAVPSGVTGITAAYHAVDHFSAFGIATTSFQYADATVELWVRPDTALLTPDHQLLFESGGGQNGIAVLLTNTGVRFIGSAANARTIDLVVPTAGLELSDFIQILYTIRGAEQKVDAVVRDVTGQEVKAAANGKVVIGTNAASLLALTGNQVDLGGRTEVATAAPAGLTGFAGEIAILNVYNRALTAEENTAAFQAVLPVTPSLITGFTSNVTQVAPGGSATLTWKVAGTPDSLTLSDGTAASPVNALPLTAGGNGTLSVSPTAPTTYTLRATRAGVTHSASVSIYAGLPVITSFAASSTSLIAGESATVSWAVTGADTITLSPAGVEGATPSARTVSPAVTTNYVLTATNLTGSATAEVLIDVRPEAAPVHHYLASSGGNDEFLFVDEVAGKNWTLNGVTYHNPLVKPSAYSGITASYQTADVTSATGISVPGFQYPEFTVEVWARPDPAALSEGHQIVFESGGGQNGTSVLLTQTGVRFLGSSGNVRTLDAVLSTEGLNLDDFLQIVYSVKGPQNLVDLYVRDATGKTVTQSVSAKITAGANVAGLFHLTGGVNNLGGRTELADVTPVGLSGFAGEIALLNVYDRALTAAGVTKSYQTVAGPGTNPPVTTKLTVTSFSYDAATNRITLQWDSKASGWYQAEISSDLAEWEELGVPFQATAAGEAIDFQFPAGETKNFIRIRESPAP